MKMVEHDLGALVCFVGENVRYITSVFQGNWKDNIFIRYCVLPRDGDPVLFETAGSDSECVKIDAPWLEGNIRPAMAVLKENGVERERIGIDILKPGVRESTSPRRSTSTSTRAASTSSTSSTSCAPSRSAAAEMKAGNTTADVAAKLPKYADDEHGTVTLQQFAHSTGLSLYGGMWISRAYSLDYVLFTRHPFANDALA